jgi:S1-C subfamily serine protease
MVINYVKHFREDNDKAKKRADRIRKLGWSLWVLILLVMIFTIINFFVGLSVSTPSAGETQAAGGQSRVSYQGIWRVDTENKTGSCFLARCSGDTGVFITAKHVIENATQISIKDQEGDAYSASVVCKSDSEDVAVISAEGTFDQSSVLKLGESSSLKIQDNIVVVGWPQGIFSVTEGTVSNIITDNDPPYVMTDAVINPGNSGGPAIRKDDGTVVGMVVSTLNGAQGMHFLIPIDFVKSKIHQASPDLSLN